MSKLTVISYAVDAGGILSGSRHGPGRILERGLVTGLEELGWEVDVCDEISLSSHLDEISKQPQETDLINEREVRWACNVLNEKVKSLTSDISINLILGGNHSLSTGSLNGFSEAVNHDFGLIWVDAHADLNTFDSSQSKCFFGTPVASLMGIEKTKIVSSSLERTLRPDQIVYLGLRDIDAPERKFLEEHQIKFFSIEDIDCVGIAAAIKETLDYLDEYSNLAMSFDLDVCDPILAPGTGTPYRGGLTFRESHLVMESVWRTGKMRHLEVVELNPVLDENNKTANLAVSLITSGLGKTVC